MDLFLFLFFFWGGRMKHKGQSSCDMKVQWRKWWQHYIHFFKSNKYLSIFTWYYGCFTIFVNFAPPMPSAKKCLSWSQDEFPLDPVISPCTTGVAVRSRKTTGTSRVSASNAMRTWGSSPVFCLGIWSCKFHPQGRVAKMSGSFTIQF